MDKNSLLKQIADYAILNKEKLYRLAYSYVKNADDALDIVQESTYKAMVSIDTVKDPSCIKTWFYRIIVNTSLDFLRKRKREILLEEENWELLDTGSEDQYPDLDLRKALEELSDNCRTIIVLRYFEDLKLDEIADILDENVNTVKTKLYKSLKKLNLKMSESI
ncbi:MAG: sigma-70 family RNA polymerase sigma factor [Lachnospiraceae bacterium]|jgi:RNA polymerase sigma-70 factor (ECF subfamily)|nr:sigma-70 family RNA polymerase sigma factor [Lachnospiraceae bacterium]